MPTTCTTPAVSSRAPGTVRTIERLLAGELCDEQDVLVVCSFLASFDPATPLRLAVATTSSGCGPRSSRQSSWVLRNAGVDVDGTTDPESLTRLWAQCYRTVDRIGAWTDITELSLAARRAAGDDAYQAWRRACCDAFDLVTRRGIGQDARARAWSYVAARVAVLHLLGATVDEAGDLAATVHSWIPEDVRTQRPQ